MNIRQSRLGTFRRQTLEVAVADRRIGGRNPVLVQSMTTTLTKDVEATVAQTVRLARAGCELVRITTPTQADAACLEEIVRKVRAQGVTVPLCADIHFQPAAAFEAVKWVEKVRINPGNFADAKTAYGFQKEFDDTTYERGLQKISDKFRPLVRMARERGAALRIGSNHGSLSDRILSRWGDTPEGMVVSALEYLAVCEDEGFDQVVFSMKSSNPKVVLQCYRMLVDRLASGGHKPYPIHLGVTEAGEGRDGRLKSAVGIGSLLLDGIGDTIRVSLTEDPVLEIPVARNLVDACVRPFEGALTDFGGGRCLWGEPRRPPILSPTSVAGAIRSASIRSMRERRGPCGSVPPRRNPRRARIDRWNGQILAPAGFRWRGWTCPARTFPARSPTWSARESSWNCTSPTPRRWRPSRSFRLPISIWRRWPRRWGLGE